MQDFHVFLEGKKDDSNYQLKALIDLAEAIKHVFGKYTLNARKNAWHKITSKKGLEEVKRIIKTPERSTSRFRNL